MVTYRFIIPGRLPGLNEIVGASRSNKFKAAKQKTDIQALIRACAFRLRNKKLERVNVKVEWHEKDKRRDKDNIRAGVKFILDALQEINAIANDNWSVINEITDSYVVDKADPKVVVEITEVVDNE